MITALIPARSGSKRIKDKNIRNLAGLPLMVHSIQVAQACPSISEVFVTTDSLEYFEIATNYHCDAIRRPQELARDDSLDIDYITHALSLALMAGTRLIVILRPTTPIRTVTLIERAISEFINLLDEPLEPTSLRSVHEMSESAFKCFMKTGKLLTPIGTIPNAPNQFQVKTYQPNGYIDIVSVDFIKETKDLFGRRIYGFETPPAIEIDTEHDFKIAAYEMALREGGEDVLFKHR